MAGINPEYKYFEISLDSALATRAADGQVKENRATFRINPIQNVVGLKVLEMEIPFTFYTFTSTNNKFLLGERNGPGVPIYNPNPVIIPPGNYTALEMITVLSNALTIASLNTWEYLVVVDIPTGKFIIYNQEGGAGTRSFSLNFNIVLPTGGNPVGIYPTSASSLGFKFKNEYMSVIEPANSILGNKLVPPFVFNLTGPNYIFLNSSTLGNLVDMNIQEQNTGPQIARVQNTVLPGEIIFWRDPDPEKYFNVENLNTLNEFDLYLTAGFPDNQNPIDLNGSSFSLKLAVIVQTAIKDEPLGRSDTRISKRVRG